MVTSSLTQLEFMLAAWVLVSLLVAYLGESKGLGYWKLFIAAVLLSPLVAICFVALAEPLPKKVCESCLYERRVNKFSKGCDICKDCEELFKRGWI